MTPWTLLSPCLAASALFAALLLAACTAYGGKILQPVAADLVQSAGFEIRGPDAVVEPAGLRFHGWICRGNAYARAPSAIRLERLGASGSVVDVVEHRVRTPARQRGCSIYDIPTDWNLGGGETVRLCAAGTGRSCASGRP
ncbi:MAG TPA: hypothetical protein VF474_08665 [Phenylobacterium sp.]